jgi:hypothetical protein
MLASKLHIINSIFIFLCFNTDYAQETTQPLPDWALEVSQDLLKQTQLLHLGPLPLLWIP